LLNLLKERDRVLREINEFMEAKPKRSDLGDPLRAISKRERFEIEH